ncbi:ABC-2 type transport system ATP-binding protein/lipopolysaccharide transport system ATP-binding protein [Caldicellulosiruptor bescii]|uniref:ABC transporter related n=2 Tax=Caldicellulosiruptor bescii TaxID=31899 RepID=B9MLK7_CALBD|nr:ABC transporter ATP-binding protein [Caldicellulosiruptor bescii]ACM59215.1 ABC transporter related [Caldicellulosiruptor bescii DSM 6725]PBC88329.1 ABC-2 type transport system ATP-binding protein/lipopolysaccharide transport system ATP-binding protein [Caldicellulosiruptor bescii]PBC92190.1 ABC-2 type transport system ATP-binding protein/lipopolysaccharide transport system ATP-binding protein [Caldicellulosiruptor bescii]PBD05000.1 ABC-2 type transport system ATP-binding protein/lipopolysac
MDKNIAVKIENVSMMFNMASEKIYSIKEYFIKLVSGKLYFREFWALKDISFKIKKGEIFGIIGLNGAGKSTLLKIIAGVLKPTMGRVYVNGTMAPLIELGAGFDFELTARENIFLNGAILGYSRKFMKEKFDEIVEFAELRDFLDVPLKNFSSGMQARLGFAIATIVDPDILIVDEILAVGDFHFQEKCERRINSMLEKGTTIVMVSHSIDQIERMCQRVLWLEKGRMKMIGDAKEVCEAYRNS